jgi:hypothetical protein
MYIYPQILWHYEIVGLIWYVKFLSVWCTPTREYLQHVATAWILEDTLVILLVLESEGGKFVRNDTELRCFLILASFSFYMELF